MRLRSLSFFLFFSVSMTNIYSQNVQSVDIAPSHGFIHFQFNVDTAFVQIGMNNPVIFKVADDDTLKVRSGVKHLYLSYPTNDDTYVLQYVKSDSLFTIRHHFDLTEKEISLKSNNASIRYMIGGDIVVLGDRDTDIYMDNARSTTEYGVFELSESVQNLTFENRKFYAKNFLVKKKKNVQYKSFFFYPEEKFITTFALVPGINKLKRKEYLKSVIIFGAFIGSASLMVKYQKGYSNKKQEFDSIREVYLKAHNNREALLAGDMMEETSKELRPHFWRRNLSVLALVGVLAYDFADIFRKPKKLKTTASKDFEFFLEPVFNEYITAGAKIKL